MRGRSDAAKSPTRRLVWFVLFWCAGVAAVGLLAYAIRLLIGS